MLNGISTILTGDMLKVLCDMGHGDELVIADANFPAETYAKRLVRCSGINGAELLKAILPLLPLDSYTDRQAIVMDLTHGDKAKGMPKPEVWKDYRSIIAENCEFFSDLEKIERFAFYERAKNAYAIFQTSEHRQYGNLLLVKGVVKPEEK